METAEDHVAGADVVMLLIPDETMASVYRTIERALKLDQLHDEDRQTLLTYARELPQGLESDTVESVATSTI